SARPDALIGANAMASSTQRLREQAARWFIRMRKAEPDDSARSRFEAWLMSDPVHAREYSAIAETWEAFDSTSSLQSLAKAMERKRDELAQQKNQLGKIARQGVLGAFMAVAAGLLGHVAWNEWQARPV